MDYKEQHSYYPNLYHFCAQTFSCLDVGNMNIHPQEQMKAYADRSRRAVTLSMGDWVYLKLQPYRLKSLANKRNDKLSPSFYGPYQIKKQIDLVAFELDLPPARKIHPVFHASLLKKAVAAKTSSLNHDTSW